MRISDWSSDVCSSDLSVPNSTPRASRLRIWDRTLWGAWTTAWSTKPRPEKTNDGSDEGQARADHGPRERQIARLGHCEGAARRGRRTRHQLSRRGDAEAGEAARRRAGLRCPDRLRRVRHGESRPGLRDAREIGRAKV